MPDYQLSKIYQIVCLTTDERYVGSTTLKTLAERLGHHRRQYRQVKNGKVQSICSSYSILERENYQIELIEAFPCNSKDELNAREGYYIRNTKCVNKNIAGRTRQEYYEDNKEAFAKKAKAYYEANKETISKQEKEYREKNKKLRSEKYAIYMKEYRKKKLTPPE
jgi:hypothetical protein